MSVRPLASRLSAACSPLYVHHRIANTASNTMLTEVQLEQGVVCETVNPA